MKHRILMAVDGSQSSLRAVRAVIDMARKAGPFELHLLNVSPEMSEESVDVLGREEVDASLAAEAKAVLAHAQRLLNEAGLAYSSHIETGRPSHVIATFSRENMRSDRHGNPWQGHVAVGRRRLGGHASDGIGRCASDGCEVNDGTSIYHFVSRIPSR